jgi:hypothetical protein
MDLGRVKTHLRTERSCLGEAEILRDHGSQPVASWDLRRIIFTMPL